MAMLAGLINRAQQMFMTAGIVVADSNAASNKSSASDEGVCPSEQFD
jgi:hypothetical protein